MDIPRPQNVRPDAEGEIALRTMRVHRQYAPDHFVIPRRKRFERDAQLRVPATVALPAVTVSPSLS